MKWTIIVVRVCVFAAAAAPARYPISHRSVLRAPCSRIPPMQITHYTHIHWRRPLDVLPFERHRRPIDKNIIRVFWLSMSTRRNAWGIDGCTVLPSYVVVTTTASFKHKFVRCVRVNIACVSHIFLSLCRIEKVMNQIISSSIHRDKIWPHALAGPANRWKKKEKKRREYLCGTKRQMKRTKHMGRNKMCGRLVLRSNDNDYMRLIYYI